MFFVISGIAVYPSLANGVPPNSLGTDFLRLMIPFLFVGLFVVLPVNVYYHAVFHGHFTGGFLQFYFGPYFS